MIKEVKLLAKYIRTEPELQRKSPPALTQEGSENQMASLALALAEKRLRNGTASAQEIVYFAKEGSRTAKTEREILEKQKELLAAKTESIRSGKRVDELYDKAIAAMKRYAGEEPDRGEYAD